MEKLRSMAQRVSDYIADKFIRFFVWGGDDDFRRKMKDLGY